MDRIDGLSLNLEKNNIDKIKELFPEAVEEGKINFDMLRAMLGDEVDDSREKYQFTWNGKAKAIKMAQTPSSATLRPCKEKSKNWDNTENLYIEGDNLEVLKQLQKTYYGKIKMIYIDPPYNTGNDFVYNDSFSNSLDNYKEQTNQAASSNPESNGRFHTDWLNMMYPRLILAKNLLKTDGVIFISIDDREQTNLKKICDELFGENNCIGVGQWRRVEGKPGKSKGMGRTSEFILIYSKNQADFEIGTLPISESGLKEFRYEDENGKFRRGQIYYPNRGIHNYEVKSPYGNTISGDFTIKKEVFDEYNNKGLIYWAEQGDHTPYLKIYLSTFKGVTPTNTFGKEFGSSQGAVKEFKEIFGLNEMIFDNPKPTKLINKLLLISNIGREDIILDFFSGSATTAHAVMKLNAEDGGNRKFIMVQLPELCVEKSEAYKAGYKNICEIGEERIRRAGEQIKSDWDKEHPQDTLLSDEEEFTTDIGFKVFKLDSSNLYEWDNSQQLDEKALNDLYAKVFKIDRSSDDIVYEIMLKYGVFDKKVEKIKVNDKTMYRVGKRYMIICLESEITLEDIKAIGELSPKTVVFNESSFKGDNEKINAVNNLKKAGVEDIKCI